MFAATSAALMLGTSMLAAGPAAAQPPNGWEVADHQSAMHYLALLVIFPLGIAAVLALLVYLPSMIKGRSTDLVLASDHRDWFGGPREASPAADSGVSETGGASARW